MLVFATPIYYYSVSGQFKTMLDRANPLFGTDYAFTKAYLLATAAENEAATVEGTVKAVQGWVDCFDRCELAETIFAGGVSSVAILPDILHWNRLISQARRYKRGKFRIDPRMG